MSPSSNHSPGVHRHHRALRFLRALFSLAVLGWVSGCEESSTASYDTPSWTYSGYVLDGASGTPLEGASIRYLAADGRMRVVASGGDGGFVLGAIPYGQVVLRFDCVRSDSSGRTVRYAERILTASSYNESSSMSGAMAAGARIVRLFPLQGSFSGEVQVVVSGSGATVPARGVPLRLVYRDTTFVAQDPSAFAASTDSQGAFRFDSLPADSGLQLSIPRFRQDRRAYAARLVPIPMLRAGFPLVLGRIEIDADTASDYVEPIAASNVLDASGLGLSGVPVATVPWFRIAFRFDPAHLDVQLANGATALAVSPRVHGDTVFLQHADPLPNDAQLTASITGLDSAGVRFAAVLDGNRRFRTAKPLAAVESNVWIGCAAYRAQTGPGDTIWVRFGETLSSDPSRFDWSASSGARTIYGRGASVNAATWTHAETLFVVPDARLNLDTTGRVGFKVTATSTSGARSAATEVLSDIASNGYAIRWSNAVNALGVFRDDLGSTDSVVVVANRRIASLLAVVAPDAGVLPTGLQASDVSLRGDTIVYRPSTTLVPGTVYGLAFDLRSPDGTTWRKAIQVRWKTRYRMSILSAGNRDGSVYRRFRTLGDSLVVRFSVPVDTSRGFVVHMVDVKGTTVQTRVSWNAALDQATVRNVSPLPLANWGSTAALGAVSDTSRAVADVSFDLQSKDGERIVGLRVAYDSLRIHTEAGLCAVSSNILRNHADGYEVLSTESVVDSFPIDGAVRVGFDRALDTAWIRRSGDSTFATLQSSSGPVVASDLRFEDGGRTIVLDPRSPLAAGSSYYVQFVRIPGLGIRTSTAIGRHGGVYSGTTSSGFLVGSPFTAR